MMASVKALTVVTAKAANATSEATAIPAAIGAPATVAVLTAALIIAVPRVSRRVR